MAKLVLTKDPSHKGYYQDADGNLYVFRFGGRPIKVDEYREDKPHDTRSEEKMEVDSNKVIDHRKSATVGEDEKFLEAAEADYQKRQSDIKKFEKEHDDHMVNHLESQQKDLVHEINNTEERKDKKESEFIVKKDIPDKPLTQKEIKERAEKEVKEINKITDELEDKEKQNLKSLEKIILEDQKTGNTMNRMKMIDDQERWDRQYNKKVNDEGMSEEKFKELWGERPKTGLEPETIKAMTAREFIKKQTGQREMYQSIAKLMNDNEDKLSSEEWKALDNARMILKQNPELIADDSILSDTSKPIHERLSKYMNDNEYKLDSGVWGPLYEANQELRKHDAAEITKLKDRYQKTRGVSDDWFTKEGRKLGMKDEDIADAIYTKKGAEAQGSTDDNIKRIIANKEKQHYERLIKEYKDAINNPKTGEWDRQFMKSELPGLENKAEMFANYEAEFIKRVNRDDEVFNVKYRDPEFVENFKARGLDEAYALKDEWLKYSDDVHIYDSNGNEILEDSQKHYTSPTYEKNKINEKKAVYRERLDGADRSTLISMIHNLGLNWNVERFTDQQLYRMLEKELNKKGK